ncbi:Fic/DOC family N-terminal domain-containing protein [Methylobacter luteus]|uniref:Fic/DOC family N-terminal domain-containing protein n=1 Tax=Methylobacter luteus TaxID=415 RepID=UPI0004018B30|nr:Fic/DOC family N-terminal domain-containing protein [Methylobacter luteus]
MHSITPLERLDATRFESPAILKKLAISSRRLAELKGIAGSIPNQEILINTLGLQEAKDSSEIENIVTTHDELFKDDVLPEAFANPAAKEVLRYRQALRVGFEQVRRNGLLTANHIIGIQAELERNHAGFRKLPGTALKDGGGQTVYTPRRNPPRSWP